MAGTPQSGTCGRLASSGTPGWPRSRGPGFLTFSFSTAELAGVDRSPTGDIQRPERGREPLTAPVCFSFLENIHLRPGTLLHLRGSKL